MVATVRSRNLIDSRTFTVTGILGMSGKGEIYIFVTIALLYVSSRQRFLTTCWWQQDSLAASLRSQARLQHVANHLISNQEDAGVNDGVA